MASYLAFSAARSSSCWRLLSSILASALFNCSRYSFWVTCEAASTASACSNWFSNSLMRLSFSRPARSASRFASFNSCSTSSFSCRAVASFSAMPRNCFSTLFSRDSISLSILSSSSARSAKILDLSSSEIFKAFLILSFSCLCTSSGVGNPSSTRTLLR